MLDVFYWSWAELVRDARQARKYLFEQGDIATRREYSLKKLRQEYAEEIVIRNGEFKVAIMATWHAFP